MSARGPGAFFCEHPGLYALGLAGALGTAGYAAVNARKAEAGPAPGWWALAGLTATQAVGMAASRRRARTAGERQPAMTSISTRRIGAPGPPGGRVRHEANACVGLGGSTGADRVGW
jgi:hypothetical protein